MSSSFNSKLYNNSKSLFTNSLTLSNKSSSAIELKSILLDTRLHYQKHSKPKLIKLFCNQLSHSVAMTVSSITLLCMMPYKEDEFYKYEVESHTTQSLYGSKTEKLSFKLTDECDQQLQLSAGAPTFVHCTIYSSTKDMYKICHFDSHDPQSKRYFPSNKSSAFTQNLLKTLDSREVEHYASLESIYIPSGFYNIFSAYTVFTIDCKSFDSPLKLCVPSGHYTRTSFIDAINRVVSSVNLVFRFYSGKLTLVNESKQNVNISLTPQLSYLLGHSTAVSNENSDLNLAADERTNFIHTFKFSSLATRLIKVQANFVENSLLGNSHEPIFRVVNLDASSMESIESGSGCLISFPSKHWVRVRSDIYNSIRIMLTDENDTPLAFTDESVSVEGVFVIRQKGY